MREYKITKSDLWYNIYKIRKQDWFISMYFLNWANRWTLNKKYAKTFYNRNDALSSLVLIKRKDEKNTD